MPSFSMPPRLRASFYISVCQYPSWFTRCGTIQLNKSKRFWKKYRPPIRLSALRFFKLLISKRCGSCCDGYSFSTFTNVSLGHSASIHLLSLFCRLPRWYRSYAQQRIAPPNAFPYFAGSRAVLIASPVASYLLQLFLLWNRTQAY